MRKLALRTEKELVDAISLIWCKQTEVTTDRVLLLMLPMSTVYADDCPRSTLLRYRSNCILHA